MSEQLISREALKDIVYINKGNFNTVEGIREWIDNAPTVSLLTTSNIDELCRLRSDLKSGLYVGSTLRTQAQMNKFVEVLDEIIDNAPTVEPIKQCKYCKHCGNEDYCSNCHSDHSLFEYYERPHGELTELTDEVWKLYKKHQPHLATRVIEFGDELADLLGKYNEGGADMRKPNCVTCEHFGKCEGCEKGEEE